jgi:hypothetical protein
MRAQEVIRILLRNGFVEGKRKAAIANSFAPLHSQNVL